MCGAKTCEAFWILTTCPLASPAPVALHSNTTRRTSSGLEVATSATSLVGASRIFDAADTGTAGRDIYFVFMAYKYLVYFL